MNEPTDASESVDRRTATGATAAGGQWLFALLAAALLAAVAAEIYRRGVLLRPDSRGYMNAVVHRTAAYPAFIELVRRLVGPALLPTLVAAQSVLGLAATTLVALDLRRRFALGTASALAVLGLLLSPYWEDEVGNLVLAQALAYPLFLLAVRSLIAAFARARLRDFVAYFVLAAATVLARPQFVFLHAISLLVVATVALRRRTWRRDLPLVACFLASLLLAPLADRAWRWWRHGTFAGLPYTGHQLITAALYISDAGDAARFDGATRAVFEEIRAHAARRKLLPAVRQEEPWRPLPGLAIPLYKVTHFRYVYNRLSWGEAFDSAARVFCPECDRADAFLAIDPPLREIALGLIRAHPGRWLLLYLSNLLAAAAPSEWLLLALLSAGAAWRLHRGADDVALAFLLAAGLHVTNLALIAAVEPELDRYVFPTAVTWLALAVIFVRSLALPPPAVAPTP
jgi:hypothetical protein